jgi:hypothetical protein
MILACAEFAVGVFQLESSEPGCEFSANIPDDAVWAYKEPVPVSTWWMLDNPQVTTHRK